MKVCLGLSAWAYSPKKARLNVANSFRQLSQHTHKTVPTRHCLVTVVGRLVRAVKGDADVLSLLRGEGGELGTELGKVGLGDLLVELLREEEHLGLVALRVLVGLLVGPELDLGEHLVGERVR